MKALKRITAILLVVAALMGRSASAAVIYVDVDANGNDDGTSWTDAYNDLQDGLDDANSADEIWVAEGTYKPTDGASRTVYFELVSGLGVYGGFDATETARSERDWTTNETILSGDVDDDGVLDSGNSYHVVLAYDCNSSTVLDGFTITMGYANGSGDPGGGGGIRMEDSSCKLANCTFTANYAAGGGAMAGRESGSPTVANCVFKGNSGKAAGGAMLFMDTCHPTVTNCLFFWNTLSNSTSTSCKGGVLYSFDVDVSFTNCTFVGNAIGIYNRASEGGAIFFAGSSKGTLTLTNCIFWGNSVALGHGGELVLTTYIDDAPIGYCDIEGGLDGPKVTDWGNNITDGGGNVDSDPCFVNVFDFSDITFAAGTTTTIEVNDANIYEVNDVIEYDNDATPRTVTDVNTTTDIVTFANDALDANSVMGKAVFNWSVGVTDVDEDLHLTYDSACIEAGDPNGSYSGQTDIDGEDRVMDGDADCNEVVDIGADEAFGPDCWNCDNQCYGDADCDDDVDFGDLGILKAAFFAEYGDPNYNACADFDKDGDIDFGELGTLKVYFGDPNLPSDCNCGGTWPPQ
jgi:hypothetical protein